ncbi:MAG: 3-oxoacyl-[acyl-carrier-protein] reductase [Candidatus Latescibacterota bacterium]|nr:MAG: 3-oxoacyl-[acyl-carrier-protein] reductase [Candidatus Latescibacterota bacterium]
MHGVLGGKVALVTGAAQGIGKAIALLLAEMGADVAVVDVNLERAEETAGEIRALGRRATAARVNVTDSAAVEAAVEKVVENLGGVDILVNNAGITRDNLLLRMKEEEWDAVLSVNLKGTFNFTKAVARPMLRSKGGRIVNIASVIGVMGNAGQSNYAASKAGVIGFTRSVAREFASRGITANAIAPGFIQTAMTDVLPEKARQSLMDLIPLKRLGTARDVADVVAFLVSPAAGYITGQVINVDGGMVMA